MGAVRMCAASMLRRRVWGTMAAAALVAVAGGAVLAAWAGARRTDSAYERLLAETNAPDVTVVPQGLGYVDFDRLVALPGVERAAAFGGLELVTRPPGGGSPLDGEWESHFGLVPEDAVAFRDMDRVRVLEGRLPDPARADEVAVNELFVEQTGLGVGDRYRAYTFDFARLQEMLTAQADPGEGSEPALDDVFVPVDLRIVGVGRGRGDIFLGEGEEQSAVLLTPAFGAQSPHESPFGGLMVQLRDGPAGVAAFQRAASAVSDGQSLSVTSTRVAARTFDRAVSPYGDALRLFAVIAGVAGLVVVGQALFRLVAADAADGPSWAALGMSRWQRTWASTGRALLALGAGAVLAVVVATAATPLFPLGPARDAEPSPGLRVDAWVFGVGGLVLVGLMLVPVVVVAVRRAGRTGSALDRAWTPSRLAERLARAGAPVSAVNGVRFALQRDSTPGGSSVATALIGLVVAISAIGGSAIFAANLDRVVTTPARYGWNWDVLIDTYDDGIDDAFAARIEGDRDFAGLARGTRSSILLDGRTTYAYGFAPVRGASGPLVVEGRMPAGRDEIALGAQALADLGKSMGDRVSGRTAPGARVDLEIVGRTVLPSNTIGDPAGLGEHAVLTAEGLRRLDPVAGPSFYVADLVPAASVEEVAARVEEENGEVVGIRRPADIQTYARLDRTPLVLAGLLAVLGVGVLAHLLATSVRARRRDLAVLKTLGCGRRQVGATVAWQATTLVVTACIVGIPAGIILGRLSWLRIADELGIGDDVAVPVLVLMVLVVATLLVANLIALGPARRAARLRPAVVLRSE